MVDDNDLPPGLAPLARNLQQLGASVPIDPRYQGRLYAQLLTRHHALQSVRASHRPIWLPLPRRLSLALTPVVAALSAAAILTWSIVTHAPSDAVQAAQLSRALTQAAPTLTSWRVSVRHVAGQTATSVACPALPLGAAQRLYIRGGQTYLYSAGQWYRFTRDSLAQFCPAPEMQWPFTAFAGRLASGRVAVSPVHLRLRGRNTVQVTYSAPAAHGATMTDTAWVEVHTGLVLRLESVVTRGGKVLEETEADYSYEYRSRG